MEGLTTAKVAREGDVNVETIRYYEKRFHCENSD
jgi:DNA-binding transcriptional MerR regulator